jgi:hypothetical protein
MPYIDRPDLAPEATIPSNVIQPPRFGGITELCKDAFVDNLTNFFNTRYTSMRLGGGGTSTEQPELPRIAKYQTTLDASVDPLETAVSLVRSYPDVYEDLPLIAVLATTGNNLKLSISNRDVSQVFPPAVVVSSSPGPYNLGSGGTLTLTTYQQGTLASLGISTYTFTSTFFASMAAATLDEVIKAINFQALYAIAYKKRVGSEYRLAIRAGNLAPGFPNKITITGGTARAALGFTVNQTDQNFGAGKIAMSRHYLAATLTVGLEVAAESENVRTELSDLLFDFFTFSMADRQYQFFGRSIFDDNILDETYQIIIKDNEVSISGEVETPRMSDPRDKIYINRINVPVMAIQYTDRILVNSTGAAATPPLVNTIESDDDLPTPN